MVFAQAEIFFVAMAGVFVVFALIVLVMVSTTFAPWLQAFTAGVPLSVLQIVGMRLRRTNVRVVVRTLVMATQAGVSVSTVEMERAYLQGVDLEKVTLALIHANREGKNVTFQELVEADLEYRLRDKLGVR